MNVYMRYAKRLSLVYEFYVFDAQCLMQDAQCLCFDDGCLAFDI
jgi:hypothetical protein